MQAKMATTLNLMFNSKNIAAMKKLMKSLMLFAAAAMALTSCDNEGLNEGIENNDTFTLAFTADAPQSRTSVAISGEKANFSWSVDENGALTDRVVFLQTQNANNNVNTKYSDKTESSIKDGVATFVTEFTAVEGATSFNYCAVYPAQNISSNVTLASVGVSLPATQTLTEDTYAPAADLMMSKVIEGVTAKDGHGGNLEFTRLAAIGKMTLKDINAGETIQSVKLTFANHVLAGDVTLNFDEVTATYATEGSNSVEVKNGSLVAKEEGNDIFFTCFPGTYSGAYRVDVTTDVATYYKEGNLTKDLVFSAGDVTGFSATVSNRQGSKIKTFTKVTTNLTDGTYLLVYEAGRFAFNGELTTLDAVNNTVSVEITNNQITGDFDANVFEIATVSGGYTIKSASGYYIGQTSDANGLASSKTTAYTNTITFNADGSANIVSGGAFLRYNAASNQARFRYYKSGSYTGQKPIALYRLETAGSGEEVEKVLESITVTGATTAFAVGSEEFVFDGTVTAHYTDGTTAVVTDKATVDDNVNMATAGEYTVNVSYTEGEVTKETSYTVTVSEPTALDALSIADFKAQQNSTTYYQLTGRIIDIEKADYGNITIADETGSLYIYGLTATKQTYNDKSFASLNLKVGDKVTLATVRSTYGGQVQGGGSNTPAYYISHVEDTTPWFVDLGASNLNFNGSGETQTVKAIIVGEGNLTVTENIDWIECSVSGNVITITASASDLTTERTATITVTFGGESKDITITQDAKPSASQEIETIQTYANKGTLSSTKTTITWTGDHFDVIGNKNTSSTAIRTSDSNHYRAYVGSTITIKATSGKTLKKIVITCQSEAYAKNIQAVFSGSTQSGSTVIIDCNTTEITSGSIKTQARITEVEATLE